MKPKKSKSLCSAQRVLPPPRTRHSAESRLLRPPLPASSRMFTILYPARHVHHLATLLFLWDQQLPESAAAKPSALSYGSGAQQSQRRHSESRSGLPLLHRGLRHICGYWAAVNTVPSEPAGRSSTEGADWTRYTDCLWRPPDTSRGNMATPLTRRVARPWIHVDRRASL